jgi:hypothetical protein
MIAHKKPKKNNKIVYRMLLLLEFEIKVESSRLGFNFSRIFQ